METVHALETHKAQRDACALRQLRLRKLELLHGRERRGVVEPKCWHVYKDLRAHRPLRRGALACQHKGAHTHHLIELFASHTRQRTTDEGGGRETHGNGQDELLVDIGQEERVGAGV